MSILVFIEHTGGTVRKSSREAVSYAYSLGQKTGGDVWALALGSLAQDELAGLGRNGAARVLRVADPRFDNNQPEAAAMALAAAVEQSGASVLILPKSPFSDMAGARLAAMTGAALANNVVELPELSNGFRVKRSIYTGKAFAWVELTTEKKILGIRKSAVPALDLPQQAEVLDLEVRLRDSDFAAKVMGVDTAKSDVLLTEAEIVVSGGRGMKGPEHWNLLEDLARSLGAATGCSKPVSDLGWRPHHEHVGQTGVKVSPNLYIAVGISGAVQHLAGVNTSRVLVAINKDPDAPFFKAADYGIVGDAFSILPRLTKAVQSLKS
jgi:electron transfer flavoprotein alpha subunit